MTIGRAFVCAQQQRCKVRTLSEKVTGWVHTEKLVLVCVLWKLLVNQSHTICGSVQAREVMRSVLSHGLLLALMFANR